MQELSNGLYEQLINKMISSKLKKLDKDVFYIKKDEIDKVEASRVLAQYLFKVLHVALSQVKGEDSIARQIEISNKVIKLLSSELEKEDFTDDLIETEAKMLSAIFNQIDSGISDFDRHIKEISPYTRLSQSELFTGNNAGISLESELKKEILSSDRIDFLVSFIKWSGIRIFEKELSEFTERGGQLRVITTSYMGATDLKAIKYLSSLKNTEIKVSYNTKNERLHAKAYLFHRNTGFNSGYIGSSNISRSALTSGLEWNLKVSSHEVGNIVDKFQKTFNTYWEDSEFEPFTEAHHVDKLRKALRSERQPKGQANINYFDIKPYNYQQEILEKLQTERKLHSRYRNLLVAATGTGKTVISAFDYKNFRKENPGAKLLFVAHRKEILTQAQACFQGVLKDNNFGNLWVDGIEAETYENLFVSVQTLRNRIDDLKLSDTYYDFIIIDEVHHISASSYRPILERFNPKVLLGLTATPERHDNQNILEDFSNKIAAEIRLPQALNKKLLTPFQYFGITDSTDLSKVEWKNGRYLPSELTRLYTANDNRVRNIIENIKKYLRDENDTRALCFCVSQDHAIYMAEKFSLAGYKADYIISNRKEAREETTSRFRNKDINYLFVVDIFNEGVDIPEIDTVLFLRPTESLTIFLQQLGRGLRLHDDKDCLTVLDFVGNSRPEYDFESKFRQLVGKTNSSMQKEIEDDFPHLPLGCSVVLERKAKSVILENIKRATSLNKNQLINKIINFKHQSTLELNLKNFTSLYNIPLEILYKRGTWKSLCELSGEIEKYDKTNEKEIQRAISKKWISCNSYSYFQFILNLAKNNFFIDIDSLSEEKQAMCLMLHYDIWQTAGGFNSLQDSIRSIGKNKELTSEIIEILEILIDKIDFIETDIHLPYAQPLKVHARYTRDQILSAFGDSTFDKKSSKIEGVVDIKKIKTELLFINLVKSEKDFSPSTLYNDYAISDTLFHWQSQNATRPDTGKGLSYINHQKENKKILLFVRESRENEYKNTHSFVFLGEAQFVETHGSKPMNITWKLNNAMPPYLWNASAKMAIG